MRHTTKILPSRLANVGCVQLNNPTALHALDLDMIRSLTDVVSTWQADKSIRAIIFSASSESKKKSFCAGGDVKTLYLDGIKDKGKINKQKHGYGEKGFYTSDFFREEFRLNHLIATQKKNVPQISLWDGIVMGGGVGISVHGKYRIVTENTLFAMPETGIGLFPDVGSTYWLSRLSGGLGEYIGLTGARLKASDLLYTGIGTHYIPSEKLKALVQVIVESSKQCDEGDNDPGSAVDFASGILKSFHEDIEHDSSFLAKYREDIEEFFAGKDTVEKIMIALEKSESEFGQSTLSTLQKMSPTSLKVTLDGMKRGRKLLDVGKCLQMEFRMAQKFMRRDSDFYEGIRALLIDKDFSPKWEPDVLEDIKEEDVESFFTTLEENELSFDDVGLNASKL